jgi:uncharacterized repeat protein (TIGR02543 family)
VNLRRPAALLALTALTGALVFATGTAAFAATSSITIGDYTYDYDAAAVDAGATITDYDATTGGLNPTLPATVTILGIPYNVTAIGFNAFAAKGLISVTIPDSVTSIGEGVFQANSLTSVTIPDSVTSIGDYAFASNTLMTLVDIGNSVTSIGVSAFQANSLTSVTIPDSVTSIGDYAFILNALNSVTIGNSVTNIGSHAFQQNSLISVTIPDSVTTIGFAAFRDNALTSVTIPASVTSIGAAAFYNNALTSVAIGNSVTSIGDDAFNNNPLLTSVTFLGAAPTIFGEQGLGASFGSGSGLTVYYNWAFDVARAAGGFTAPTWQGYNTVKQATVAFSMSGRGTAPATQTVAVGASASEPADPTSTGALFTGWYTDVALTTRADFDDLVTSNLTLYAGWAALADTGADITPVMVVVPGLLVVVGLGLVLVSRRRMARTS